MSWRKLSAADGFAVVLSEITHAEPASTARDYIWMGEFGPQAGLDVFQPQRDGVVRECERRGNAAVLESIRRELTQKT